MIVLQYCSKRINPYPQVIMKKKDAVSSTIKLDRIESSWEDNPAIQMLAQYGRNALIALLAIIALVFLVYRVTMIGKAQEEMDFWNADKEFRTFTANETELTDPLAIEDALIKLNALMNSNPELNAKYDGMIAQTLINRGDAGDAIPFANRGISRTKSENTPFYTSYSESTLLIAQQRYEDALKQSQALDSQMRDAIQKNAAAQDRKFGDTLFALNILRIGILQQQLGLKNEERKTWQEWKQYSSGTATSPLAKAFQHQRAIFSEGKTSISDYIDGRLAALKAKAEG